VSEKDLVTVTIDGKTTQAPKGTMILEAARALGIRIPHYCYHPGLSIVGSCRMCLVAVDKTPKLQPSCATPVTEGMVVHTQTPETVQNRRAVLEFLLANHPLDCPVCDQAGECELQNYYMAHGLYDARFNENKTKRKKAFPIGSRVILDQERCILCTRCIRFTREITRTSELGVINRGHRSKIDLFLGMELSNPYSANVVDVCPVGALTDRDFRFKCRVWFLGSTPSICPGCSRGCNIEIHWDEHYNPRYHDKRVHRLKPRYNSEVNRHWICDEGRYSYHAIDDPARLKAPRIREAGVYREVSWEDAIYKTAAALKVMLDKYGPNGAAVLASPQMSNEELFLLRLLFRDRLKIDNIAYRVPLNKTVYSDDFLVTADKSPNARGAETIGLEGRGIDYLLQACSEGRIRILFICHHDLTQGYNLSYVNAALSKVGLVVFLGSWDQRTAAAADIQLPAAVYAEKKGTFTNIQGRVQQFHAAVPPLGESLPDLDIITRLAEQLGIQLPSGSAEQVFPEIGQLIPAFAGMSYESVGLSGQLLK
jgi:NADH-quinone oxidoreductase subunit G